jgi:hypothetical protein
MPYADPVAAREYANKYQRDRKLSTIAYRESESRRAKQRDGWLKRAFGLSSVEYDVLFLEQGGVCAICSQPETTIDPRLGTPRRLAVDHDHETNLVRGLLCRKCNVALGLLGESPLVLAVAMAYLEGGGANGGQGLR